MNIITANIKNQGKTCVFSNNGADLISFSSSNNHSESNNTTTHDVFSFKNIPNDQSNYKIFRKWDEHSLVLLQ